MSTNRMKQLIFTIRSAFLVLDKQRRTEIMLNKLKEQFPTFMPTSPTSPRPTVNVDTAASRKGGKRGSVSHKFGASVKQTWVSKKRVSKRDRRKSIVVGAAESSLRVSNSIRGSIRSMRTSFAFNDGESSTPRTDSPKMLFVSRSPYGRHKKIAVINVPIHENDQEQENDAHVQQDPQESRKRVDSGDDMVSRGAMLEEQKSQYGLSQCAISTENSASNVQVFTREELSQPSVDTPERTLSGNLESNRESKREVNSQFGSGDRTASTRLRARSDHQDSVKSFNRNTLKPVGGGAPAATWDDEESAIADVFFLSWPELFLEAVQALIMIIALYFALYFTNFIVAAETPAWQGMTLVPAVVSSLLLIYIVKSAVLLSALHAVDCDAILEVLEQTEGARLLSEQIQAKIITRLAEMGTEPQSEIFNLFGQIDSDGSGYIRYSTCMLL